MPTAAEFQALHDELRQLGAVFVQAANLGDQELALWGSKPEPPIFPASWQSQYWCGSSLNSCFTALVRHWLKSPACTARTCATNHVG
ncbi:TPA: hypothetical protein ACSC6D_006281 [Pseudomonas aeruginosa]|jgi:hypothetical protein